MSDRYIESIYRRAVWRQRCAVSIAPLAGPTGPGRRGPGWTPPSPRTSGVWIRVEGTGGEDGPTPLPSLAMGFRMEAIRGRDGTGAVVDYRLTRQSVIAQFRKGRLSRLDVCDAHPELRRAAERASSPTDEVCPICEEHDLALVTYAFGPRLPAGGRCITSMRELAKLERSRAEITCYVVEVCPGCGWNHLSRTFLVGGNG